MVFCSDCDYFTDRKDNLRRHMDGEHSIKRMVITLLQEIISEVINKENEGQMVIENEEEESPFLRDRNIRVAAIQAEFQRMFPNLKMRCRS